LHYHNVFLVRAGDKDSAVQLIRNFLDPFYEGLEVEKYTDGEEEYWGNPQGEWDWYQIGGRWAWSDLYEKYKDVISRPSEDGKCRYYINPYHDEEYKDKTIVIEFPDGSKVKCRYGSNVDFAIKTWLDANPTHSEVIDANNPKFWEIIEGIPDLKKGNIEHWEKTVNRYTKGKDKDKHMMEWAQKHLEDIKNEEQWTIEHHFWNVTENRFGVNIKTIKEDPEHWFLVNIDLHN